MKGIQDGIVLPMSQYPESWAGLVNDNYQNMKRIPFEKVKVPTLIMHGDADCDVPFSHAEKAHAGIEGSELLTLKNGCHALQTHEEYLKYVQLQLDFLKKHMDAADLEKNDPESGPMVPAIAEEE